MTSQLVEGQRRISDEYSDSESIPYDIESGDSILDNSNGTISEPELSEQGVQTETYNKCMQTNTTHLPNANNRQLCTCELQSDYTPMITYYNPPYRDVVQKQFDVKSCVFANTENHTLAVPVLKRHVLQPHQSNMLTHAEVTPNISSLLDACITNTLVKQNIMCQKLVYMKESRDKSCREESGKGTTKKASCPSLPSKLEVMKPVLCIPEVKFTDYSKVETPPLKKQRQINKNGKGSTKDGPSGTQKCTQKETEKVNMEKETEKLNSQKDSLKESPSSKEKKSPSGRKRKCNGWQFEGESREETKTLGTQIITRRHYDSISRGDDTIHIYDAVVLKSGLRKGAKDSDYLARIAMFWEDLPSSGTDDHMMMTIYWYYKPSSSNCKLEETSNMEVLASRHRDDNSVACIMEKCYVLTFAQFCRFQAQKKLFKETGKAKQKVVPEKEDYQSRFIPRPDVDESLVYFCRYGFDYRTGKIIK